MKFTAVSQTAPPVSATQIAGPPPIPHYHAITVPFRAVALAGFSLTLALWGLLAICFTLIPPARTPEIAAVFVFLPIAGGLVLAGSLGVYAMFIAALRTTPPGQPPAPPEPEPEAPPAPPIPPPNHAQSALNAARTLLLWYYSRGWSISRRSAQDHGMDQITWNRANLILTSAGIRTEKGEMLPELTDALDLIDSMFPADDHSLWLPHPTGDGATRLELVNR